MNILMRTIDFESFEDFKSFEDTAALICKFEEAVLH